MIAYACFGGCCCLLLPQVIMLLPLRPLLILLLGSSLILVLLVWFLLIWLLVGSVLNFLVPQLATCKACVALCTGLGVSSSRSGTLDGHDHPAVDPSSTSRIAGNWVPTG